MRLASSLSAILLLSFQFSPTEATRVLVQLKENYDVESFVSHYYKSNPNMNVAALSQINVGHFEIGDFKGVVGDFDSEFLKSLLEDQNVGVISLDRDLAQAEVQDLSPVRMSQQKLRQGQSLDNVYDQSAGIAVDVVYILDFGTNDKLAEFNHDVIADYGKEAEELVNGHGTYVAKKANLFDDTTKDASSRTIQKRHSEELKKGEQKKESTTTSMKSTWMSVLSHISEVISKGMEKLCGAIVDRRLWLVLGIVFGIQLGLFVLISAFTYIHYSTQYVEIEAQRIEKGVDLNNFRDGSLRSKVEVLGFRLNRLKGTLRLIQLIQRWHHGCNHGFYLFVLTVMELVFILVSFPIRFLGLDQVVESQLKTKCRRWIAEDIEREAYLISKLQPPRLEPV